MFEVFVHVSQDLNLVPQYASLKALFDNGVGDVGACPRIASILHVAGQQTRSRVGELLRDPDRHRDELGKQYSRVLNAFESTLLLEPKFLPAYYELAQLKALVGKKDEAHDFCRRGLAAAADMKKAALHASSLSAVKNAPREIEEFETNLNALIAAIGPS